jgi:2-oxoglutarate ferredoxin oxidoreductase subunit alpha
MSGSRSLTIRFEGDSGDGIITMGKVAARTAARLGYHVYTYSTFLAVVRGGQVTFQVRISTQPLVSQGNEPDILVALNRQAVKEVGPLVKPGGLVIHPPWDGQPEAIGAGVTALEINYKELSLGETGSPRSKNIVAAGVAMGLLGFDEETAAAVVSEQFAGKGEDVTSANWAALGAGFEAGRAAADAAAAMRFTPADPHPRMLLSGNEAVALGALAAGVRFFAGYPITPASEIMEWLAAELPKVGGVMFQAEDEIAAVGMCIGASFGGVKSMTATSGPGLSLMIELLGLAGMAEIPMVVVDVQRAGPSTGMPTKEAQGDLHQAAQGTHGEVPRVVLAPQTVADCFEQTVRAVNVAHQFQIPVILLSSQSLSHRMQTIEPDELRTIRPFEEKFYTPPAGGNGGTPAEPYKRYAWRNDGMPVERAIPGTPGGMYRTGGLEHDEFGNPDFDPEVRSKMVLRRRIRMHAIARHFEDDIASEDPLPPPAPLGLMSWGATASVALEVLQQMQAKGIRMTHFMPRILWPMPDAIIERFLSRGLKYLFVCELNATRQFAEMLRARYTATLVKHDIEVISITKDDGLPFTPGEIERRILEALHVRNWTPEKVTV